MRWGRKRKTDSGLDDAPPSVPARPRPVIRGLADRPFLPSRGTAIILTPGGLHRNRVWAAAIREGEFAMTDLSPDERAMAEGRDGPAAAMAMRIVAEMARILGRRKPGPGDLGPRRRLPLPRRFRSPFRRTAGRTGRPRRRGDDPQRRRARPDPSRTGPRRRPRHRDGAAHDDRLRGPGVRSYLDLRAVSGGPPPAPGRGRGLGGKQRRGVLQFRPRRAHQP